jgi:hypothetical protein
MDRAELQQIEHRLDREIRARVPDVRRVALSQPGDDPDELLVRVLVDDPSLDDWARAHDDAMKRLRRELSLRFPPARWLEFTASDDSDAPRITMLHNPALADEPLPPGEIVRTVLGVLRVDYVFPDLAERAATAIEARLAAGEYDGLDEAALAERLTSQLYDICADKHLRLRVGSPRRPRPAPEPARTEREWERLGNYGIRRAEVLDGNIGYLDLHGVAPPQHAGPVIAAAMELIGGTYALIIDLRRNHGGSPHGVAFWCSYLFPGADTHLGDIFHADTGETTQFWTLPYVPGSRYLDRPVYLLTSSETFSGGEDLAYSLQAQGRAQVIGETTGGGAHPTRGVVISPTLALSVPFARSINPVTGTNWQGTGVVPDIASPAAQARDVACRLALEHVLSLDVPPPVAEHAGEALAALGPS